MGNFATAKIIQFAKKRKDGRYPIYLRITYLGKYRVYSLNRACLPSQWDSDKCRFKKSWEEWRLDNDLLANYEKRALDAIRDMEREKVVFSYERLQSAVFADLPAEGTTGLAQYINSISADLAIRGKHGNSLVYDKLSKVIESYKPNAALPDVDGAWLESFERWMDTARDLSDGGKSIYLRTLKAACKRAVREKKMPAGWNPFLNYSFSHLKKTKAKKAAPIGFIRALEQLSSNPAQLQKKQQFALDMFLFSFYMRGMNLADIAALTKQNIQGGRLVYTRKKTGVEFSILISEKAGHIITRYFGLERLFPVLLSQKTEKQKTKRVHTLSGQFNQTLRAVAADLGFDIPGLTFYTARHTYADSLKKAGVSTDVISELMGHSSVRITDSYLKSFDLSVLDEADGRLR